MLGNRSLRELLSSPLCDREGREKKEKPTQKQLVLQAPPAQRPACRCGAGRLGWAGGKSAASPPPEACAAPSAGGAAPVHPAPRTAFRLGRRAHARRAPDCRAPRTAQLPGDPPAAQGWGSVSAWPWVCSHGRPSGRSRAVLTCAPSAEQRAESGGARARHPRGGPCSGGGPLLRLRCQGGGRFALLLIHEAAVTARDWTDDVPAPASLPLTPDAVVPRPSEPTHPPLLLRWGRSGGAESRSGRGSRVPRPQTPHRAARL